MISVETWKCVFLRKDTSMAVAKLSGKKKTCLVKCESAFFVNKKFRNLTILSISTLQGSYSSALKAVPSIFLIFSFFF